MGLGLQGCSNEFEVLILELLMSPTPSEFFLGYLSLKMLYNFVGREYSTIFYLFLGG